MTRDEFTQALKQDLQRRGIPFDPQQIPAFVESIWSAVEADPDPARWASALPHIEGGQIMPGSPEDQRLMLAAQQDFLHRLHYEMAKAIEANPAFHGCKTHFDVVCRILELGGEEGFLRFLHSAAENVGRPLTESHIARCIDAVRRKDQTAYEAAFNAACGGP
jgi:hypothetical protein